MLIPFCAKIGPMRMRNKVFETTDEHTAKDNANILTARDSFRTHRHNPLPRPRQMLNSAVRCAAAAMQRRIRQCFLKKPALGDLQAFK